MDYICDTCGEKVSGDALAFIKHNEAHIMDEIKKSHPDWVEENGMCQKCYNYFKDQLKGNNE